MSPLDRRSFVKGSLAGIGAAGLGAAGVSRADSAATAGDRALADGLLSSYTFDGHVQSGVLTPIQGFATFVALDSTAANPQQLARALQLLSAKSRQLMEGGHNLALPLDSPPADNGVLGPVNTPDGLTITIGFGASFFDDRYGFADKKPAKLVEMPRFGNDNIDPAIAHGDILLQVCADHRDTVTHAIRELMRNVREWFAPRWSIDGFRGTPRGPQANSTPRNLFAFRDGTANPDVAKSAEMNQLVWAGANEPAWAKGGTYQVMRIIRMHAEFWDRVGLREQEAMIGRHRDTGAPLGATDEFADPRFDLDPQGKRIPLDAHIRLANPRSGKTDAQRILRRPFNYDLGFDEAGTLNQGLLFVAFNQDPERQFAAIQTRLNDEPMIDYITPVGGGYFFVPPGTQTNVGWIGSGLFV